MAFSVASVARRIVVPHRAVARRLSTSVTPDPSTGHSRLMTRALTLEELDRDLYRAPAEVLWKPPAGRAVYGGQIAALSLRAAYQTLSSEHAGFTLSSFHSYFLLPGDPTRPIVLRVARLRDGRSFCTRSIVATQAGEAIYNAEVQFHRSEPSTLEHQEDMPADVPPPETLSSMRDHVQRYLGDPRLPKQFVPFLLKYANAPFPVDIRPCKPVDPFAPQRVSPARQLVWMRCTEDLGPPVSSESVEAGSAEAFLHTSAITYASDWSLASTMMLPHGLTYHSPRIAMVASLDHCLWWAPDTPFRADEWMVSRRGKRGRP
jgi:acyl-CoA thioesterase-2